MTAAKLRATHCSGNRPKIGWCRRADSNRQPIAYEAIALPLSYCGVQKGPSTKLLSNKPPPVEEAQLALSPLVPARGTPRRSRRGDPVSGDPEGLDSRWSSPRESGGGNERWRGNHFPFVPAKAGTQSEGLDSQHKRVYARLRRAMRGNER